MKPEDFTPIGQIAVTAKPASHPTDGNSAGPGGAVALPHDTSKAAAWLARRAPGEVDRAALSRASSLGAALTLRYENRFPVGPNGEQLPSRQILAGCVVDGSPEAREKAASALAGFLTPPPKTAIEDWLAELSVITARRAKDEISEILTISAYASRLSRYPTDIVRHVLVERAWHFWPTWAELKAVCDELVAPRNRMLAALRAPVQIDVPERREKPSPEAAERIKAMVAELTGVKPGGDDA